MVYDYSAPGDGPREGVSHDGKNWRLPAIGDRLAAVVIDFGILGMFSSLLLAPITRQIYISKQIGDRTELALLYLLSIFLFVLIGILYQTYFLWRYGATIGQRAFRIRVVHLWDGAKPEFMTALTRSIFWWFDTLCLGIPHLAVFSNAQRRPMHDRLSDTIVTTIGVQVAKPPPNSMWIAMGKVTVVVAFIAFVVSFGFELSTRYSQIEALDNWQEDFSNLGAEECETVTEAMETWPESASRLAVAMALFSAEVVDPDCLEQESYRAFKIGEEEGLAYLARAFTRNDDADLSDAYLKKVCEVSEPDSETCVFSQLVESWSEKNWSTASEIFDFLLPKGRAYIKIWAIKHFERTKQFEREIELIDQLGIRRSLASFLGTHRAVALWGQHRRDEARAALAATMENMETTERVNLASWFCYRELLDSCSAIKAVSCGSFAEGVDENSEILSQSGAAVTLIRYEECAKPGNVDYLALVDLIPGAEAAELIAASKFHSEGKSAQAIALLRNLIGPERDRVFASDAQMRLVGLLTSESEIEELVSMWNEMDHSVWEWRRLGRSLFDRMVQLGLNNRAFSLGTEILTSDPGDKNLFRDVVLAGYQAGLKAEAWKLMRSDQVRKPASAEDRFSVIEAELKEEFSARPPTADQGDGP